ncbi:MAG: PLP-dependent aminotransferase family protein [Halarcobacter sp.]
MKQENSSFDTKRSFIRQILESIDEETISFAGGLPDENLFPIEDLAKASEKIFKNKKNFQYAISNGISSLREKIATFYNEEGIETNPNNILITTGSQQALFIIAKYFESKDILVEKPSYLGAVNIFRMNKLNMKPITLEYDGIDTKEFEEEYEKVKLAYLIPDFQNPKGSLYSEEKRIEIAKTVKKYGGYIIEDAPYSELFYGEKSRSITSRLPNNSFHLGSFSKTLSPALRIGWIRANEEVINELILIKETVDLHSSGISQYILDEYLKDSSRYKEHLKNLRVEYKNKMHTFASALDELLPQFEYEKPKGGMFIYGKLPNIDTYKLVYEALKKKVVYVPGSEFYITREICDEIRFNFTHSSKEEVKIGIQRLKELIEGEK